MYCASQESPDASLGHMDSEFQADFNGSETQDSYIETPRKTRGYSMFQLWFYQNCFPGVVKISYGLSLSLPCSVDSWPRVMITWTLPNGLTLDKPQIIGRVSLLTNGTLQVKQVATFDKGTYICKASNTFGSSTLSYPVVVTMFPPRITSMLTSVTRVSRGTSVKLTCATTGIPKPDISWTLPGRTTLVPHHPFTMQGGIFMTEEGSLVIQDPVLMNSGIYKCNAKNALGADFKSTYIQVEWLRVLTIRTSPDWPQNLSRVRTLNFLTVANFHIWTLHSIFWSSSVNQR